MMSDRVGSKNVALDWLRSIYQLAQFSNTKLYKIIGPCIAGIELVRSPVNKSYSPYFVLYPLWKKDINENTAYPFLLKGLKNIKNSQYALPYLQGALSSDVLDSVKQQASVLFCKNVHLNDLINTIENYSDEPPLSAAPNSYLQAVIYEAKFKIALFVGVEKARGVLDKINKREWDEKHFTACGANLNIWLEELAAVMSNRTDFLKKIEANRNNKKLAKLEYSNLVL